MMKFEAPPVKKPEPGTKSGEEIKDAVTLARKKTKEWREQAEQSAMGAGTHIGEAKIVGALKVDDVINEVAGDFEEEPQSDKKAA